MIYAFLDKAKTEALKAPFAVLVAKTLSHQNKWLSLHMVQLVVSRERVFDILKF